jgi:hypothetical protein
MALNKAALKTALETAASSPAATVALCAKAWADAIGAYAAGLTPPQVKPATLVAAKAALQTALTSAFGTTGAAPAMETAFTTFGGALGEGMAPAFIATPPSAAVGFATLFTPPFPKTHSDAAQAMADAIHAWMTTGTAVPGTGGAAVPWA